MVSDRETRVNMLRKRRSITHSLMDVQWFWEITLTFSLRRNFLWILSYQSCPPRCNFISRHTRKKAFYHSHLPFVGCLVIWRINIHLFYYGCTYTLREFDLTNLVPLYVVLFNKKKEKKGTKKQESERSFLAMHWTIAIRTHQVINLSRLVQPHII